MSDKRCYKCGSRSIVKNGISSNGYQKYRCSKCGHSYTSKTEYVIRSNTSSRKSSHVKTNTAVPSRSNNFPSKPNKSPDKVSIFDLIITIAFGWTGYWRFKKEQTGLGILWLFTFGVFGIGWLVDIIQACSAKSLATNKKAPDMQSPSVYIPPTVSAKPAAQTIPDQSSSPAVSSQFIPSRPTFAKVEEGKQLKYSYEDVELYTLPEQMPDFSKVKLYGFVDFMQEPENTYDPNAVYVMQDGIKLGYLYKGTLQNMVNDFIHKGDKVIGFVSRIDKQNHKFQIDMGFYKPVQILSKVTLVGNRKEEVQSNLIGCYEGDAVMIEYDVLEETYNVLSDCGDFIGKLPKSLNKKLEDYNEINGYILSIDEKIDNNYNSYYAVVVALFE